MIGTTTQEIRAVKYNPSLGAARRLLLVMDVRTFWPRDSKQPIWTPERIAEIMSWSDFDPQAVRNGQSWNRLVVASTDCSMRDYRNVGFQAAWKKWAEAMAGGRRVNWNITHETCTEPHRAEYGTPPEDDWARAGGIFYPKEYFDNFIAGRSQAAENDWSQCPKPNILDIHHAWANIVMSAFDLRNDFQAWWDDDGIVPKTIFQRFADGDTRINSYPGHNANNQIEEVYILTQCGRAHAYTVPRQAPPRW